jgi:hypothetical protein
MQAPSIISTDRNQQSCLTAAQQELGRQIEIELLVVHPPSNKHIELEALRAALIKPARRARPDQRAARRNPS